MAGYVAIPKLSMAMARATIVEWKAKDGERVEKEGVILVIETEKTLWEVKAEISGLLHILFGEGSEVEPGAVVGVIAETAEELERLRHEAGREVSVAVSEAEVGPAEQIPEAAHPEAGDASGGEHIRISPVARKMAEEHMIDVTKVAGTGPAGRITKEDIEKAMKAQQEQKELPRGSGAGLYPGKTARSVVALAGMRKAISDHMYRSLSTSAQMTIMGEINMSEIVRLKNSLAAREKDRGVKIGYVDLLVFIVSRALNEHRDINCSLIGNEIHVWDEINLGVAVALGAEGLIVPVVRNADKKTLGEIAKAVKEVVGKAQAGKLTPDDVTGGTFTLTTLGREGVSIFQTPILNQQESAILGTGVIADRPVVKDGEIVVAPTMSYSLTFDHRVINGFGAEQFIGTIEGFCRAPGLLLL